MVAEPSGVVAAAVICEPQEISVARAVAVCTVAAVVDAGLA